MSGAEWFLLEAFSYLLYADGLPRLCYHWLHYWGYFIFCQRCRLPRRVCRPKQLIFNQLDDCCWCRCPGGCFGDVAATFVGVDIYASSLSLCYSSTYLCLLGRWWQRCSFIFHEWTMSIILVVSKVWRHYVIVDTYTKIDRQYIEDGVPKKSTCSPQAYESKSFLCQPIFTVKLSVTAKKKKQKADFCSVFTPKQSNSGMERTFHAFWCRNFVDIRRVQGSAWMKAHSKDVMKAKISDMPPPDLWPTAG